MSNTWLTYTKDKLDDMFGAKASIEKGSLTATIGTSFDIDLTELLPTVVGGAYGLNVCMSIPVNTGSNVEYFSCGFVVDSTSLHAINCQLDSTYNVTCEIRVNQSDNHTLLHVTMNVGSVDTTTIIPFTIIYW